MALYYLYEWLYERLYDGPAIARIVAHTMVRINGSASSVQTALHGLYVISTSSLRRLYVVSTSSLRRLYERLYNDSTMPI